MQRQAYCEYLQQTSAERLVHSRASLQNTRTLLELAEARLSRARKRSVAVTPLEDPTPEVIDAPPVSTSGEKPAADPVQAPEVITGRDIEGELVRLDGRHFVDCNLTNCTLEYGGSVVVLESTQFHGCSFRFTNEAAMTVQLLECFGVVSESAPSYVKGTGQAGVTRKPN